MDIRPLKPKDAFAAETLIRSKLEWVELPPLESLLGKFEGDKLVAVIGFQMVPAIECLAGESALDTRDVMIAMDSRLANFQRYFFFMSEKSNGLAESIEKHFGEVMEGFAGKLFVRTRK